MKFDTPATTNPIDAASVVGLPHTRIEGPLKVAGTATYAAEYHDVAPNVAYGYVVGAAIGKGTIASIEAGPALAAPGVRTVVTHETVGELGVGEFYVQRILGGPRIDHYHQAVAVVVADSFERARFAAGLVDVRYVREEQAFDLAELKDSAPVAEGEAYGGPPEVLVGDFETAFSDAPIRVDEEYTTPDQAHAMMEPHATMALWEGERLTCWTAIQQLNWGRRDLGRIIGIPPENIRLISAFIGGGFGGKGTAQSDLVLAALAARAARCPVKVVLQRPIMFNNTIHRPKTIQRVRLGAGRDGRLIAIAHESWSGNLAGGRTEPATIGTRTLYAAPNRLLRRHIATLDLAEGNAMRAPGEAPMAGTEPTIAPVEGLRTSMVEPSSA